MPITQIPIDETSRVQTKFQKTLRSFKKIYDDVTAETCLPRFRCAGLSHRDGGLMVSSVVIIESNALIESLSVREEEFV